MYTVQEMVRIAKMYYELKMTQVEIAEKENLSRPTVSRILDAAVKEGIISFVINYPLESISSVADELQESFSLRNVFVIPAYVSDINLILNDVSKVLTSYLAEQVTEGDIIGISWGNTLSYVASNLMSMNKKDVMVVQLNGGVSTTSFSTGATSILEQFSKALPAKPYTLSVPAIVDSSDIASSIIQDSSIKEVLAIGRKSNIAVFGIGKVSYESVLYTAGYFTEASYKELLDKGAIGDVCSRFYNLKGEVVDHHLNNRTISLQLDELKQKDRAIAIACGEDKAPAILGALNGKYINTLFTDELTAKAILTLHKKMEGTGR
jgi:deoxyribonucleoside regulator